MNAPVKLTAAQISALEDALESGEVNQSELSNYEWHDLLKRAFVTYRSIGDMYGDGVMRITDAGRAALKARAAVRREVGQ